MQPPDTSPERYPIRHSLPGENGAYTENEAVYWMLEPWEQQASDIYDKLINFFDQYMNPNTANPEALDWLAQLAGYNGIYWDSTWPKRAKRALIREAYSRVWPTHGTLGLFKWLFSEKCFDLDVDFLVGNNPFRASVNVCGDRLGGNTDHFHVRLPNSYLRDREWVTVRRLLILFSPLWVPYTLSYETFRADYGRCGEIVTS